MKIIVMKFGGTSVADINRIKNVASIIRNNFKKNKLVVVLSAMAGVTNKLIEMANEVSCDNEPTEREMDVLLSTGEQTTIALTSMAINALGGKAISLTGAQAGIVTDGEHTKARISNISPDEVHRLLDEDHIVILAGFQGSSPDGRITTLGRGGSDITAVALASSLKADRCDIYTDVDGVYSTDPNIDQTAKKIEKISYEEMLEMSSMGAKVLQTRSVELAMKNNLSLQVLSSITNLPGTMIVNEKDLIEKEVVSGVSYSDKEAKVTISGVPDIPGISAKIFGSLADNNINVDMIVQNISQDGITANLTFTIQENEMDLAKQIIEANKSSIKYTSLSTNANVSKISVIGVGMKSQSGVAQKMFQTLANKHINILAISTSEIKISVLIDKEYTHRAVKSLHIAYSLN